MDLTVEVEQEAEEEDEEEETEGCIKMASSTSSPLRGVVEKAPAASRKVLAFSASFVAHHRASEKRECHFTCLVACWHRRRKSVADR